MLVVRGMKTDIQALHGKLDPYPTSTSHAYPT
jgi:hypothetical protein